MSVTISNPIASETVADAKRAQPAELSPALPDEPLVRIRPSGAWVALNLRDLWTYRELLYFLMWRDVKVRYKQTLLGAAWAVLQPLAAMLVFALFFGKLAGMPSDGIAYPLFVYAGLVAWTFFSNAVTNSGNSLVGNANLITKVYFPRMIIPCAAVGAGLIDLALTLTMLLGMMFWYSVSPGWTVLLLPVPLVLAILFAIGVGMTMSALNVKYRDVRYALPFVVQLWMFASPVIYPASMVPDRWRWVLWINPLAGIIEAYRSMLFGLPIDWALLGLAALITVVVLVAAAYGFRRLEKSFADVV
jgi:lipopolysaccharide transport system permease protein